MQLYSYRIWYTCVGMWLSTNLYLCQTLPTLHSNSIRSQKWDIALQMEKCKCRSRCNTSGLVIKNHQELPPPSFPPPPPFFFHKFWPSKTIFQNSPMLINSGPDTSKVVVILVKLVGTVHVTLNTINNVLDWCGLGVHYHLKLCNAIFV